MRAGVIGLGDMGSGLALNLMKNGIETWGFDLDPDRQAAFEAAGGHGASGPGDVGRHADVVFVMVLNGPQAKAVILGQDGLVASMKPGGIIVLTATIRPEEAREIAAEVAAAGLGMIDTPVSGGRAGAQGGTLTMMAAGSPEVIERARPALEAVSATIHIVGTEIGDGQTVKACLQSLIGAIFSATFEAAALAARAGISGQVIHDVFTTSGAGCGVVRMSLENIIDRKFVDTGSHIATMHKDLTISLDLGEKLLVPLNTAAVAMQLFHAGKAKYPDADNWVCTRILEEIVGVELHRDGPKPIR